MKSKYDKLIFEDVNQGKKYKDYLADAGIKTKRTPW